MMTSFQFGRLGINFRQVPKMIKLRDVHPKQPVLYALTPHIMHIHVYTTYTTSYHIILWSHVVHVATRIMLRTLKVSLDCSDNHWACSNCGIISSQEKLDDWMNAVCLTPLWGLDRRLGHSCTMPRLMTFCKHHCTKSRSRLRVNLLNLAASGGRTHVSRLGRLSLSFWWT